MAGGDRGVGKRRAVGTAGWETEKRPSPGKKPPGSFVRCLPGGRLVGVHFADRPVGDRRNQIKVGANPPRQLGRDVLVDD